VRNVPGWIRVVGLKSQKFHLAEIKMKCVRIFNWKTLVRSANISWILVKLYAYRVIEQYPCIYFFLLNWKKVMLMEILCMWNYSSRYNHLAIVWNGSYPECRVFQNNLIISFIIKVEKSSNLLLYSWN